MISHRIGLVVLIGFMGMFVAGTGCATAIRGDSQKVRLETEPPNATINIDGKDYKAPVEISLKRNRPHTFIISAPGYQTIAVDVAPRWDGASLGNIVMPGGSVGFGVDTLSGADKSFDRMAKIKLNKSDNPSATQPVTMYHHRGKVVTKAERDKLMAEEKEYHSDTDR